MGYNILLTIGALLLLGTLLVSTNNLISFDQGETLENEYVLAAYGAAQTIISEAKLKAFDESSVAARVADTSGLSLPEALGYDGSGELVPAADTIAASSPFSAANPGYPASVRFDDVDDYNGYKRVLRASRAYEGDTVHVQVSYVSPDDPGGGVSWARTMCKRMTVTVRGRYLPAPVTLTYGFTY